jgi:hypothetical protein
MNPNSGTESVHVSLSSKLTLFRTFPVKTWVPIKPNLNLPNSYFINTKKTVCFLYGIEAFREFWISPKHTSQEFF